MINTVVDLKDIQFTYKEPPDTLLKSIERIGIAIPVHVKVLPNGKYACVDGNQRCSACFILKEKNPLRQRIPVMLTNDYSKSGSGFWGPTQNHH